MIKRFTITGADDYTDPVNLAKLSKEFPFVEWGILHSKSQNGLPRFPSLTWLDDLVDVNEALANPMDLSIHLCGSYVRHFVVGRDEEIVALEDKIGDNFQRVQLNFHAISHTHTEALFRIIKKYGRKEFIFQHDGVNDAIVKKAHSEGCKVSALFDKSGGAGILPKDWPALLENVPCGYAGGLSPENLKDQIEKIEAIVGDTDTWIDIEAHVRSKDDKVFDLNKVRKCLEIAAPYILK